MGKKCGIDIKLDEPDSFLLVKESLTRMGIASFKTKTLFQTAHILHSMGTYRIIHFKELFILDGKPSTITEDDYLRRNTITKLLQDWGLLTVINKADIADLCPISNIKILPFKEKDSWELVSKFKIGKK